MTAESLSPRTPAGERPGQATPFAAVRDLTDSILFYGIVVTGMLGPICLAFYSELLR